MKKILLMFALCAMTIVTYAEDYQYLAAVTSVTVDTLESVTKNQFKLTIEQTCKRTDQYNVSTVYKSTCYLVLNSDDRTLEGTYSTEKASSTSSSSNVNDQTINLVTSYYKIDGNSRKLDPSKISTFTINKVDDTHYSITSGELHFKNIQGTYTYNFTYCYDVNEIQTEGIQPTPFVFGYSGEYETAIYNYDMTVNGISVIRDDSEYDAIRYFLTLSCVGKNRETGAERNYEVQLAIYPGKESIVGSYATQGGTPLYASNSYVKDLKINKTRYLANDSISAIQIKSKGTNLYSFYGGTLTCTDIDLNHLNVYQERRIEAVHYYHFSDNDGEGIPFGYDESQTVFNLTPTSVEVDERTDEFQLTVLATDGSINYTVYLDLASDQLTGSFSVSGSTLALTSKVERGSTSSYVTTGSIITITSKGNNTYTISGNLLCENGNTYQINAFDFQYGNSGGEGGGGGEGGQTIETFHLTADNVTIENLYVDKYNYFVTVIAHSSANGVYEVGFDLWPLADSPIGSFSTADNTLRYTSSFVHKIKAGTSTANIWYRPEENMPISLTIVSNGDGTCTLNGEITAVSENNGKTYKYIIAPFTWEYSAEQVDPGQQEDPYRFEPTEPTTINFIGDVVNFRERDSYIEVTLNEMANETYDWIELRLISDTLDMPAGTYTINDSYAEGTLTSSKGYLGGTAGDDPCYVAIRANQEDWGQYTPYYLKSGNINVSFNAKGDSIIVTGTTFSHNGTTVNINVKSYNMLYVDDTPKEPEFVVLDIDTVVITYLSNLSDSTNNFFVYTFNFSHGDDYPTVLTDVILSQPMALVEGTYSLDDNTLDGIQLAQNQSDFEMNIFGGGAYHFVNSTLSLTPAGEDAWTYEMFMKDDIGSEYSFRFTQAPHIILYPEPEVDPKDQPYIYESQTASTIEIELDQIEWKTATVEEDGMIDINLSQVENNFNGLYAHIYLWMYTPVAYPAANTYPVLDTEEDYTFSASPGCYANSFFPCYLSLKDEDKIDRAVWYITAGNITISYDEQNRPIIDGNCSTYWGSTIIFHYAPKSEEGVEDVQGDKVQCTKVLRDGQIIIRQNEKEYNILGISL